MNTILNLFYIAVISVIVIDLSGIVDEIKSAISFLLTHGKIRKNDYRLKPLDCSFCVNFWAGLIYLIVTGNFSLLYLMIVLLFSLLTVPLKNILQLLTELINFIIAKIERKL